MVKLVAFSIYLCDEKENDWRITQSPFSNILWRQTCNYEVSKHNKKI